MSEWVSVDERLPEVADGDYKRFFIAVYRGDISKTYTFQVYYLNGHQCMNSDDDPDSPEYVTLTGWYETDSEDNFVPTAVYDGDFVTHWMPLPSPPVSE